jgi:hypothetical protein
MNMQSNTTSRPGKGETATSAEPAGLARIVIRRLDKVETTLNCAAH